MKHLSWFSIPAIILTLLFVFLPATLWVIDRAFRKPLGRRLFAVQWNLWGIFGALICWGFTVMFWR